MLCVLAIAFSVSPIMSDESDMRLVHEFRRRGLYSLAEHSCEQQLARPANDKQKIRWTILLSDTLLDHAWNSVAADRNPLAVESFRILRNALREAELSEADRLRLDVHFLESVVRVRQFPGTAAVVHVPGVGNVFDGSAGQVLKKDVTLRQRIEDRIESSEERIANRHLPIAAYERRVLRDRLRLATALLDAADLTDSLADAGAIPSLTGATHVEPPAELLRNVDRVITDLDNTARSSALKSIKLSARFEIARLNRLAGRLSEAEALQRSLAGDFPQVRQRSMAERVRIALHQDEPTLAGQLIEEFHTKAEAGGESSSAFASQELAVLKLEQLTSMLSIAVDLKDPSLSESSIRQFEDTLPRVLASTGGVWRDRAAAVAAQFKLIQSVGATAAAQMQRATVAEKQGDGDSAGRAIREAIERMPSSAPLSQRLSIRIAAARSAAQAENWLQSTHWLEEAVALTESGSGRSTTDAGERRQQTTAERDARILMAWVRGQIYRDNPGSEERERYEQSLRGCLTRFGDAPEAERVRVWLASLIAAGAPSQALELLADEFTNVAVAAEARQLTAGILLHAISGSGGQSEAERIVLRQQVRDYINSDPDRVLKSVDPGEQPARLLQSRRVAEAELHAFMAESDEEWQTLLTLADNVRTAHRDLAIDARSDDPEISRLRNRLNAAVLKALCATQRSKAALAMSARITAQATTPERLQLARALSRSIPVPHSGPSVGNENLGAAVLSSNVIEELLQPELMAANPGSTTSQTEFALIADILLRILTVKDLGYAGEQFLETTTSRQLPLAQQRKLAAILDPEHARHPLQHQLGRYFWNNTLRSARQGTADWLEASLTLAEWYAVSNESDRARKILTTVELLYPDWGGPQRMERAARLEQSLDSK